MRGRLGGRRAATAALSSEKSALETVGREWCDAARQALMS
jgi:hypothetical protein